MIPASALSRRAGTVWGRVMSRIAFIAFCWVLALVVTANSENPMIGSWQFKNSQMEIVVDFLADGTFRQVAVSV